MEPNSRFLATDDDDPTYNWKTFNLDRDLPRLKTMTEILSPLDPDLRPYKKHGGKLIIHHGWSDPGISSAGTLTYYNAMTGKVGGSQRGGELFASLHDSWHASLRRRSRIATNPLSRKVGEIARDARVTLMFFDTANNEYVTVLGTAATVTDPARKAAHWKAEWAPFYKQQTRGSDFQLFEVKPFRLEVDSPSHHINNDPATWRPTILPLP